MSAQQELFSADTPKQPFTLSGWAARHEQPPTTLSPQEAAIVRAALSYTMAMLSRGCPYAPEWTDEQVVDVAGPLVRRLPC